MTIVRHRPGRGDRVEANIYKLVNVLAVEDVDRMLPPVRAAWH